MAGIASWDMPNSERREPWDIVVDHYQRLDYELRTGKFSDEAERRAFALHVARVGTKVDARLLERVELARTRYLEALGTFAVDALVAALDELNITAEQRLKALTTLHARLHARSQPSPHAIEGDVAE